MRSADLKFGWMADWRVNHYSAPILIAVLQQLQSDLKMFLTVPTLDRAMVRSFATLHTRIMKSSVDRGAVGHMALITGGTHQGKRAYLFGATPSMYKVKIYGQYQRIPKL